MTYKNIFLDYPPYTPTNRSCVARTDFTSAATSSSVLYTQKLARVVADTFIARINGCAQ